MLEAEFSSGQKQDFAVGWTGLVLRTLSLWKRRLLSYIGVMATSKLILYALYIVPVIYILGPASLVNIVYLPVTPSGAIFNLLFSHATAVRNIPMGITAIILTLLMYTVTTAATVKLTLDDYGNPGAGNVIDAFGFSLRRISILLVSLAIGFTVFLLGSPLSVLSYAFSLFLMNGTLPLWPMLLLFLLAIVAEYVGIRAAPVFAIAIDEDHKSPFDAMRKAFNLTDSRFWHVFGAQFILNLVILVVVGIVNMLLMPLIQMSFVVHFLVSSIINGVLIAP
ncbi:MAG: hypothetical protein GF309_16365, partial [Candidatus Lokiarchaeota archaeon]|nr:hypothetical protein [Candidatus Lokiarchaeota archaeon]